MQVLPVLGLRGGPLRLQTFPPEKLKSPEVSYLEEKEPICLSEL